MGCGAAFGEEEPAKQPQPAPQAGKAGAAAPVQPKAQAKPKPKAQPKAKAKAKEDRRPLEKGGGGSLPDFLAGLGVSEVPKAEGAMKKNGIHTRGDFFVLDKEYRQELDGELKNEGVTIGDRAKIKGAQNVGAPVKQGNGEVTVVQLKPGQAMQTAKSLERVYLGCGWKNKNRPVDVDCSVVGFNSGNSKETVYFGSLKNKNKSLAHSGDILSGSDAGKAIADLERIYVWLTSIPAEIDTLVLVVNVFTAGVSFADLDSAYIRMTNADTNQEMARMTLSGSGLKGNALIFCKLYRTGGPKDPWHFQTLGLPLEVPGMTSIEGMMPKIKDSGCAYPPPGAIKAQPGAPPPPAAPGTVGPDGKKLQTPEAKKKSQTPTGVYVAGALAVATVAGVAAATAIFMSDDPPNAEMFNPANFEAGVDFADLVPTEDDIVGIGEGIADAAEGAFEWAEGVMENVDFDAIGENIGDAVGAVGEFGGDVIGQAGDLAGDVFTDENLAAAGDFAGDAAGAVGDFAGDAADMAGDLGGDALDAAPGALDAAGDYAGDAMEYGGDAFGAAADAAPGAFDAAQDAAGGIADAAGGIDVGGIGEAVGGLFGGLFGGDD